MLSVSLLISTFLTLSNQIFVPDEAINQKPNYSSGIKTANQIRLHHNYSKVYHQTHQSFNSFNHQSSTPRTVYPIYNPSTEIYILNGSRIPSNSNPTREILKYNKQKRAPKVEIYKSCPKNASGQFVYEFSCNQFLNCWKGRGYVQNCAAGTLFNPKTLECDYPDKVYCITGPRRTILQEETNPKSVRQIGCPKEFTGLIPNYTDCSKFINCVSGIENIMECPKGTLFDVNKNICDFAHKAACFNGENVKLALQNFDGRLDFKNAKEHQKSLQYRYQEVKCPDGFEGLQQHPTDCSKFLNCANGQTFIQDCSPGTVFNPFMKICDFPYNVRCQNGTNGGIRVVDYDAGYYGRNNHGSTIYTHTPKPNNYNFHSPYGSTTEVYRNQYYNQPNIYSSTPYPNRGWNNSYYGLSQTPVHRYDQDVYNTNKNFDNFNNKQIGTGYYPSDFSTQKTVNIPYRRPGTTWQNTRDDRDYGNNDRVYGTIVPSQEEPTFNTWRGSTFPNQERDRTFWQSGTVPYQQQENVYGSTNIPNQNWQGNIPNRKYTNIWQGSTFPNYERNDNFGRSWVETTPNRKHTNLWQGNANQNRDGTYGTTYNQNWAPSYPNRDDTDNWQVGTRPNYNQNWYSGTNHYNKWQSGTSTNNQRGSSYDQPWSSRENPNTWQGSTLPYHNRDTGTTPNYDQIININHFRNPSRPPYRNSYEPFFGSTSSTPSNVNDYDDYNSGNKFIRATTPQISKQWPPPFPSTDINADYVFEYEDNPEVTLVAENSIKHSTTDCSKNDFRCSSTTCIPKHLVCNGIKDCSDGTDETKCLEYVSKFSVQKNKKLAVLEKERWDNVTIATCALLCVESRICRSFNYRKIDKTCFLTDTNEALTGAIIWYYPIDYYELNSAKIDCRHMFVCSNKKCIDKDKICDGTDDCGDRQDEKGCKPEDYGYSIRLSGTTHKHGGKIEVTAFGKTGYICDDNFGMRDANVVCKELGYHLGALEVKRNSYYNENSTTEKPFFMMDDVSCLGNESRLMDCDFNGWGVHNCLDQEIVGVVCKTPIEHCASDYWQCDTGHECLPLAFVCDGLLDCSDGSDEGSQHCDAPIQLRLVNGTRHQEGRVEIRHHGIWGTICDDDFNEDAAKVICKQLGYRGAAVVKKDAYFGVGSGPIWLDQVFCSGNETSIEKCSHWNWGEHNCDHSEDVGIICTNSNTYEERHSKVTQLYVKPQTYPDRCGYRNDNIFNGRDDGVHFRVVRGSEAKKGEYPWQAALRVKGKTAKTHWCGGVIISSKFVLTAAHCLMGYAKGAYVVIAGDYNVDENEGSEQEAYIEDFYIHENFRQGHKMNNDIALIKLKGRGFYLGDDVQAICLPDVNTNYETELNCTISGFGSVQSGSSAFSHNLRAGWVPLQKRDICTMPHVYGNALTDGMFCAGSLDEGTDSCDGDSGGPLACLDNGLFTLYGLTSWGQHCGYANKPGVYVKVAHYKRWIDEKLEKYSKN